MKRLLADGFAQSVWKVPLDQGLHSFVNLLIGYAVARHVDVADFGVFVASLSLAHLLASMTSAGTFGIAAVDAVRLHHSLQGYVSAAETACLTLAIFLAFLLVTVLWAARGFWSDLPAESTVLLMFGYAGVSLILEAYRRFVYLGRGRNSAYLYSIVRFLSFGTFVIVAGNRESSVNIILMAAIAQSLVGILFCLLNSSFVSGTGLRIAHLKRIASRGSSLGLSSLLSSGFEQFIILSGSIRLGSSVAGGWRAATYLFGVLAPVLLTADAFVPKWLLNRYGTTMRPSTAALVGATVGAAVIGFAIATLNAVIYLPMLGKTYIGYEYISYAYVLVFISVALRQVVTVPLRRYSERGILYSSLVGITTGIIFFYWPPVRQLDSLTQALVAAQIASTLSLLAALASIPKRSKGRATGKLV